MPTTTLGNRQCRCSGCGVAFVMWTLPTVFAFTGSEFVDFCSPECLSACVRRGNFLLDGRRFVVLHEPPF
jgi:hypothetical protein